MPHIVAAQSEREEPEPRESPQPPSNVGWTTPPSALNSKTSAGPLSPSPVTNSRLSPLKSIQTLAELIEHPDPRIRLSAARTTVQTAIKTGEIQDIRQRTEVIDDAIELLKDQS